MNVPKKCPYCKDFKEVIGRPITDEEHIGLEIKITKDILLECQECKGSWIEGREPAPEEVKKDRDFLESWEKAFGKAPEDGWEYNHLYFSFGWRAIIMQWGCKGIGFGELAFIFDPEKGLRIDDEMMGEEFVLHTIDEAVKRIDAGQKADVSKWVEGKGPTYAESSEGNEKFIKSMLLTFKHYLLNKTIKLKDD